MPSEQMPVTAALVTWARERAGFSLEEASAKFKKIEAWEAGQGSPTYPQLEELAEAFKVPIAVFFFPDPPTVPSITESFRTLSHAQMETLAPRMRLLLRKAKAFQISLSELNRGRNPANHIITRDLQFPVNVTPQLMADNVRDYLAVTIDEQRAWATAEIALERWRTAFADAGVVVFKDAFKEPRYAGFCLYDEEFPIIYVNNSAAKSRQIFTLFHELGHLLFHTSGLDLPSDAFLPHLAGDARRIEVLCNRFAGTFLVPASALSSAMRGREPTEATARTIAEEFNVSWLVVYRRFLDRHLITREEYAAAQAEVDAAQNHDPGGGSGGNYYNTTMSYLGDRFIHMALQAYHQSRITEAQLADHLGVSPRNLSGIEDRFLMRSQA